MNDCDKCKFCSYTTTDAYEIVDHVRTQHKHLPDGDSCVEGTSEKFSCETCDLFLESIADEGTHYQGGDLEAVLGRPYQCKKCVFTTHSKFILQTHNCNLNRKIYYCRHCTHYSYRTDHLKEHNKLHTPSEHIQWLQCEHCPFKGKRLINLKQHMLVHRASQDVKWLHCENCTFKTRYKYNLSRHTISKHKSSVDIQWLQCEECDFKAKRKEYLTIHAATKHTSWADFQCENCEFRCKTKKRLNSHIRYRHRKFRWFQCEHCDFKTQYNCNLKQHVSSQHTDHWGVSCEYRAHVKFKHMVSENMS